VEARRTDMVTSSLVVRWTTETFGDAKSPMRLQGCRGQGRGTRHVDDTSPKTSIVLVLHLMSAHHIDALVTIRGRAICGSSKRERSVAFV